MNDKKGVYGGLTGNQLKIIAVIAMTCDHVGKQILPEYEILQIIGRLALPIFAFMIAEGCRYTRDRKRYLISMAALAFVCQVVYFFAMGSLYQCILVTFSLSIVLIYLVDWAMNKRSVIKWIFVVAAFLVVWFVCEKLSLILWRTDFAIDYGIWGVLLPVAVYYGQEKWQKLLSAAGCLICLAASYQGIQWYALTVIPLLALYNGKRGRIRMKNFFYVYYPVHLVVIYWLDLLFYVVR